MSSTPSGADTQAMKKVGLGIAVVLALVLLGGFVVNQLGDVAKTAKAGDCARISGALDNPRYQALDCGSEQATVKIAKILPFNEQSCPSGGMDYSTYTGDSTLCLMPNLAEGKCYTSGDDGAFKQENCTTESPVKIVKKVDGLPEEGTVCPEGSSELRFAEPASVYCMGVHEGS